MPEITETFFAEDRNAWRKWLEVNAACRSEIWLVVNKKHVGEPCVSLNDAVEEALCFGWIDGTLRRIDDRQHAIRFTPRRKDSRWSQSNRERVERMIAARKMTPAGLELVEHARRTGEWEALSGTLRDRPVPPDLSEALSREPEAEAWFQGLAPSHRRQYLAWIYEAKREETRRRRVEKVLGMIRERIKPGM